MPAGYFDDGERCVELGEHVFATAGLARSNLLLEPAGRGGRLLENGGGVLALTVTGRRLRANLGDAERYLHELLCALAVSGSGTLGVEDALGRRSTFGNAVCTAARGVVHGRRYVEVECEFACAESEVAPGWSTPPATPDTYPGTCTEQQYVAGGVALGTGAGMRVQMRRRYAVRTTPRARGARAVGPQRGAHLRLVVLAHLRAAAEALPSALADLARASAPAR